MYLPLKENNLFSFPCDITSTRVLYIVDVSPIGQRTNFVKCLFFSGESTPRSRHRRLMSCCLCTRRLYWPRHDKTSY